MKNTQDSMVIAVYRLWTGQPRSHGLFPQGTVGFYLLKGVHTCCSPSLMGMGSYFPEVKLLRHEANH